MESPVAAKALTLEDVFDCSVEELKVELERLGQETKGLSKAQMQKNLAKLVSPSKAMREEWKIKSKSLELKAAKEADEAERQFKREEAERQERKGERDLEMFKLKLEAEAEKRKVEGEAEKRKVEVEQRREEAAAEQRKAEAEAAAEQRRVDAAAEQRKAEAEAAAEQRREEAAAEQRREEAEQRKVEADERRIKLEAEVLERRLRIEAEAAQSKLQLELEVQEKDKVRQHELKLKKLENNVIEQDDMEQGFRMSNAVKFVPKFDELDVEHYLLAFEKAMQIHKFPKDKWTGLIHTQLTGKAQKVFSELSVEECQDYDILKQALLRAYARVPEFYRKRFRTMKKGNLETYSNFAFRMSLPFNSWIEGEGATKEVDKLMEVVKLEQFVNCLPTELHRWVIEKKPESLSEAAKLADEFAILYKPFKVDTFGGFRGETKVDLNMEKGNWGQYSNAPKFENKPWNSDWRSPKKTNKLAFPRSLGSPATCGFCGGKGHVVSNCWHLKSRNESNGQRNFETNPKSVQLVGNDSCYTENSQGSMHVHDSYRPFCSNAWLYGHEGTRRQIVLLRDSGSLQTLVSRERLGNDEFKDTKENRLIQGVVGDPIEIPLVEIKLDSERVKGIVLCGLIDKLPEGVDVLIGSDIADMGPIDISVVTRAQAALDRVVTGNEDAVNTHASTQLEIVEDDLEFSGVSELFDENEIIKSNIGEIVSRNDLIQLQRNDVSMKPLFELAQSDPSMREQSYYDVSKDVLVRHWKNKIVPDGIEVKQIVVPTALRNKLLQVAHDIPSSGHLGTQKTIDRLLCHFWWPGVFRDVKEYCRSGDVCQRLGKGAVNVRAPLINLPVISSPFSRLAVDVVGPLQTCGKSGNKFILTVMDLATHYPLAFPLKEHCATEVAKSLIQVFTMFGFPDELLSDCGTEFMSKVMQVFLNECQVTQLKCSPYHPQTNGCLERFQDVERHVESGG